jgi:hypothetical protein
MNKSKKVAGIAALLFIAGLVFMGCASLFSKSSTESAKVQPEVTERAYLYLYSNSLLAKEENDLDYIQYFDGKMPGSFFSPARGQPASKPPKELKQTLDIPAGVHTVTVYGVRRFNKVAKKLLYARVVKDGYFPASPFIFPEKRHLL